MIHLDPDSEKRFLREYADKNLPSVRTGIVLGMLLYGLFCFLDIWAFPVSRVYVWKIRFLVIIPFLLIMLSLTYVPACRRYGQHLALVSCLVAGAGIVWMMAISHPAEFGSKYYYAGLVLVIIALFTVFRIRFYLALATFVFLMLGYDAVAIFVQNLLGIMDAPPYPNGWVVFLNNNYFFVAAAALGTIGGYTIENYMRLDFVQREELETRARDIDENSRKLREALRELNDANRAVTSSHERLEETVRERTRQLEESNLNMRQEIANRIQVEERLRESMRHLEIISVNSPDIIWTTDMNLRETFVSQSVESILGFTAAEYLRLPLEKKHTAHTLEMSVEVLGKELEREREGTSAADRTVTLDLEYLCKDGTVKIMEVTARAVRDTRGEIAGIQGVSRDVSERRRGEEERKLLYSAMNQSADGLVITAPDGTIEFVNPAFERLSGYANREAKGQRVQKLVGTGENLERLREAREAVATGQSWLGRLTQQRKDGAEIVVDLSVSPVVDRTGETRNLVAAYRDVTREIEIENRLRQAQKMEVLGTLAGGIAHEFNNLLYPMMGYTEMILEELEDGSQQQEHANEVLKGILHASEMVKELLRFSRQSGREVAPVHVSDVAEDVLRLVRPLLPATIEVYRCLDRENDVILGDSTDIHQVVMNLITNAFYAMKGCQSGLLSVVVQGEDIDAATVKHGEDIPPGAYVRLDICDTGSGIPPDVRRRILEPYFTTKPVGEGTGMGLAVVHGVVEKQKGCMVVQSEVGKGTTFSVYLPRVSAEVGAREETPNAIGSCGNEHVMVVDDDVSIVEMLRLALERLGYRVTAFSTPEQAARAFLSAPDAFDLVLTDMTMPGMTGIQLAAELFRVRSDVPVVLCTGFSDLVTRDEALSLGLRDLLHKPVRKNELAEKLHGILAAED